VTPEVAGWGRKIYIGRSHRVASSATATINPPAVRITQRKRRQYIARMDTNNNTDTRNRFAEKNGQVSQYEKKEEPWRESVFTATPAGREERPRCEMQDLRSERFFWGPWGGE